MHHYQRPKYHKSVSMGSYRLRMGDQEGPSSNDNVVAPAQQPNFCHTYTYNTHIKHACFLTLAAAKNSSIASTLQASQEVHV